ncbi:MAG TPA: HEAT repeat domain-containing protein [Desulfuromonadales bacterium]|nr:HEAT repeat domain-containing protein [Desulfuromonadales bacterium]
MSFSFYRPPKIQDIHNALGSLYRAVLARKFYPPGHPSRRSSLNWAHAAMLSLLDGNTLSLSCSRTGFSFPDGELLKGATRMSTGLAYELFLRRVKKITLSQDLFQEDVEELVKLLSLSPEQIHQSGGMDGLMEERGVRTIWVNEFDLAIIRGKRERIELAGIVPEGGDESEIEAMTWPAEEHIAPLSEELSPELQLQALLGRIAACTDDDIYLFLVRQAVACCAIPQLRQEPYTLFLLIDLLAGHISDRQRSQGIQECAQFALEQIVITGDIVPVALEQAVQGSGLSLNALQAVLKAGGAAAVTAAIDLLGRSHSAKTRKMLTTVLGSLGEAAVPILLNAVHDSRWFMTRNICAILGTIASRKALPAVTQCLQHTDIRVRKEAIRSLTQIGGDEAESGILNVLQGPDTELYSQAIASLGVLKSKKSLNELMKIVTTSDIFLRTLSLKIDALAAIALIGDRQVTPLLVLHMVERNLLAVSRGRQLKTAIALCLGKLGDIRAVPILTKLSSSGGELGAACAESIRMIEKNEGRSDGSH